MALASDVDNIRYNGTGRAYAGTVGGTNPGVDLGELENFTMSVKVTTEKMKSTRNAARATIIETETEREATLSFGLREQSEENLQMALLGGTVNTLNQTASYADGISKTWVLNEFVDLGFLNVFRIKASGTITGTLAAGDTVTGDVSTKTGKIAWVSNTAGVDYLLLYHVTGAFTSDTKLSKDVDNYLTLSGYETEEDVVITDTAGTTLRVQGTDYDIDPDYGYVRKIANIADSDKLYFDYEAVTKKYLWAMSAGSVTKRLVFVTDGDDSGPRQRYTFHKVQLNLNGDVSLLGEKAALLNVTGTVLADTSQSSGQEYYKVEMMS